MAQNTPTFTLRYAHNSTCHTPQPHITFRSLHDEPHIMHPTSYIIRHTSYITPSTSYTSNAPCTVHHHTPGNLTDITFLRLHVESTLNLSPANPRAHHCRTTSPSKAPAQAIMTGLIVMRAQENITTNINNPMESRSTINNKHTADRINHAKPWFQV